MKQNEATDNEALKEQEVAPQPEQRPLTLEDVDFERMQRLTSFAQNEMQTTQNYRQCIRGLQQEILRMRENLVLLARENAAQKAEIAKLKGVDNGHVEEPSKKKR